MSEEADTKVMKKCLEDAGIFEDMSSDMVKQYYKAIKESQSIADNENQSRQIDQRDDLLKQLDESINEPSSSQTDEDIFVKNTFVDIKEFDSTGEIDISLTNESSSEEKKDNFITQNYIKDICQFSLSYSDMCVDTRGNLLPVVCHNLKYVAIQNSANFLKADSKVRLQMMKMYFEEEAKLLSKLAKVSKYVVPLPKPIYPSQASLLSFQNDPEETYISRSGRQTKRKVYNYDEDDSSQEEATNKKSKSDDTTWLSKTVINNRARNCFRRKSDASNPSESSAQVKANISNTENKENGKIVDDYEIKHAPKRTPLNKKITNNEIMERSIFFNNTLKKKSRCEEILERARMSQEQRKKEEKQTESFVQKLNIPNEEITMEVTETDDNEEESVRRRIVPPIPGKKIARKTKTGIEPLPINELSTRRSVKSNSKEASNKQEINPACSKNYDKTVENGIKSEKSNQKKNGKGNDRVVCPLCSLSFQESEIEEHASNCCEDENMRLRRSTSKLTRMTCYLCDKVVPLGTNYEVHVNECLNKNRD